MIQVKGNQGTLYKIAQEVTHSKCPTAVHLTEEKGHGRVEKRCVTLYKIPQNIKEQLSAWRGLQQFIRVDRSGLRYGKDFSETSYYITSLKTQKVKIIAEGIRGHWGIENRLHWVKDLVFKEDAARIRKGNAPANLSIVRTIVINIFRQNGYDSVTTHQRFLSHDIDKLLCLVE